MAAITTIRTRNLFLAENSMTRWMNVSRPPWAAVSGPMLMASPALLQRAFQAAFRIDEEVTAGDHTLPLVQPVFDLGVAVRVDAGGHLPRLKQSPPLVHEHDLALPGGEHRLLRHGEDRA